MARERIETFESWFSFAERAEGADPVARHDLVAFANPSSGGDRTPPTGRVHEGITVPAVVNHSRWIARCPWCPCTEFVSFETGLFFCCECRNAAVGHDFVRVDLPSEKQRATVEELLLERPSDETRNYEPERESVRDLQAENATFLT